MCLYIHLKTNIVGQSIQSMFHKSMDINTIQTNMIQILSTDFLIFYLSDFKSCGNLNLKQLSQESFLSGLGLISENMYKISFYKWRKDLYICGFLGSFHIPVLPLNVQIYFGVQLIDCFHKFIALTNLIFSPLLCKISNTSNKQYILN